MADAKLPAPPFSSGGLDISTAEQVLGRYYSRTDTLFIAVDRRDVWAHEVAHRISTRLDDGGTFVSFERRLASTSHMLVTVIINLLYAQDKNRLSLNVDRRANKTMVRVISNDPRSEIAEIASTLIVRVQHLESVLKAFFPWYQLLAEMVAIDIAAGLSNIPPDDKQLDVVIRKLISAVRLDPAQASSVYTLWHRYREIPSAKLRMQIIRLCMTFPRAVEANTIRLYDPLETLKGAIELARTSSVESIEQMRTQRAEEVKRLIRELQQMATAQLPAGFVQGPTALDIVHQLGRVQLEQKRSDVLEALRGLKGTGMSIKTRYPWLESVTLGDLFDSAGDYVAEPDRSFLAIGPGAGEWVGRFNPFFVTKVPQKAWWKKILLVETLRESLTDGRQLSCPLRDYKVWVPIWSDLAETQRIFGTRAPDDAFSSRCSESCPIHDMIDRIRDRVNFISRDPVCLGNRMPAHQRGHYEALEYAMQSTESD